MIKNIVLAVVALVAVGLGVLAYTQYAAAQDQSKKRGMAELAVFCYEDLASWLAGKGDPADHKEALSICSNQLSEDAKSLVPSI